MHGSVVLPFRRDVWPDPDALGAGPHSHGGIFADNPFPEALDVEPKFLHVAFASAAVPADAYRDIDRSVFEPDDLSVGTHEIYVWYADGAGRSKLAVDGPATKGIGFTARNWNTVLKLRDLLSEP